LNTKNERNVILGEKF